MVLVALLYAILASTFVLAKNSLLYAKPFFLIGFRMLLAGMLLLIFAKIRGVLILKKCDWWLIFRVSLFHIYLSFVLEFWALQHLSALKTTLIYSSTPFIAALLSYFLLQERLRIQKKIGIFIGLLGMLPIFISIGGNAKELLQISLPDIVLFGAVASGAYAWFLVKELLQKGYSLLVINGVAMLLGGLGSFFTSMFFERAPFVYSWPDFLFWVGLLIIVSNVVVYNFYGYLLHRYTITFLTFAGFLCPSFAMLYDWAFFGRALQMQYLISIVLVTVGLYIFYKNELGSVAEN